MLLPLYLTLHCVIKDIFESRKLEGFFYILRCFFFLVQVDGVLVQPIHSLNKKGQSPTYIP